MIKIKDIKNPLGQTTNYTVKSDRDIEIDGAGLTLFPALIDPHVHFRTPGAEHKENWISAAQAAIRGGVTTVFDMPNTSPSCVTKDLLLEKIGIIDKQLDEIEIPLRYKLYFGADANHLDEIPKVKDRVAGIKIYMGSSTGDLLVDREAVIDQVFAIAAENDLVVSVHAEDESLIRQGREKMGETLNPAAHSTIRCPEAALKATERAINFADKHRVKLCVLHLSTSQELEAIKAAKQNGISVYAEVAPHHLLFDIRDYDKWGTFVQMNPPLRTEEDCEALWNGIRDGSVDFIGTDHAPHTKEEKSQPFGKAPSGVPSIELLLPLLITHFTKRGLPIDQIPKFTKTKIEEIFSLAPIDDVVVVDLDKKRTVTDSQLKTKCGWTPYRGMELFGWPVMTILRGQVYQLEEVCQIV